MDLKRAIDPHDFNCTSCDHFGFKSRAVAPWTYCAFKTAWIPKSINLVLHRCEGLTIGGILYGKKDKGGVG
jgi:uncharacterized membrane-anchored protein